MKPVILGTFSSKYFDILMNKYKWQMWPFYVYREHSKKKAFKETGSLFVDGIIKDISGAKEINFLLDEIHLPLDGNSSVTCRELEGIILNKLLYKTQFWLRGEKVEKKKVLSLIQKVREDNLTFDNINFETI